MNVRIFSLCGVLLVGVAALTLPGCGGGGGGGSSTKTQLLSPARWATFEHFDYVDNTTGGLAGDAMFTLFARDLEAVLVGWEHFVDPDRVHNHVYQGALLFNLGAFDPPSGRTITSATLTWHIDTVLETPLTDAFMVTDAMKLRVPTVSTWHGVPEIFPAPDMIATSAFPFAPFDTSDAPGGLAGGIASIDLTAMAKGWANGSIPNDGIAFQSADAVLGTSISDSNQWWQILRDFVLEVKYTTP